MNDINTDCVFVHDLSTKHAAAASVVLASGEYDGTIYEWVATDDLAEPLRTLQGHSDSLAQKTNVACLAYRSDGALISGGWDGECRVWVDGELRSRFAAAHTEAVWCVMPLGDRIVTGGADKAIQTGTGV